MTIEDLVLESSGKRFRSLVNISPEDQQLFYICSWRGNEASFMVRYQTFADDGYSHAGFSGKMAEEEAKDFLVLKYLEYKIREL